MSLLRLYQNFVQTFSITWYFSFEISIVLNLCDKINFCVNVLFLDLKNIILLKIEMLLNISIYIEYS